VRTNGNYRAEFIERRETGVEFSVLVPVYNSALSLPELVERIEVVINKLGRTYEIVLMDDGSTDNSWALICDLYEHRNNICAIRHMKNLGYNFSLQHGLEFCTGEFVITLDDDLQHPPEEILKLINKIEESDADVVFGNYKRKHHQGWRNLGSKLYFKLVQFLYDLPDELYITSFRIMRRRIVDQIVTSTRAEPQAGFMILKTTHRIENVAVEHAERKYGASGIKLSKMIRLTVDLVLHHTTLPLQAITAIGMIAMVSSALLAITYLSRYLLHQIGVDGFTTLVLLILGFGGLTAFGIGILGFYLSRLLEQSTYNLPYSVRNYLPPSGDHE